MLPAMGQSEAAYAVRSPLSSCLVTMDKARNQVILRVNIRRPSSEPRAIDIWLVQCGLYKNEFKICGTE